ncbi:branched-chain amino acid transaminase [Desulfohalobium retbaense]|uniref:Branched-chain-amino-acid aminotransferase n=1 Tax=Desulfohalobium retbaense (strain ATCC 49708 / DSM 5692 / JCM 16813 / HR100) TaxID=485915 RepID=C8X0H7_DESRD|nr:branched-chain amino acid transaminase [Desulfohalobium retbaense]ACV67802.1 branched-chain amino acid aminotransferase [Desulfohalobium retbaense DSM 5692]
MVQKAEKIWFDGELVDWDAAQVHVLTHTLHYGVGVFEGIRCYKGSDGRPGIVRLREHVERLFDSARAVEMEIPFSQDEITKAIEQTVQVNNLAEGYIRPLAFIGDGVMGVHPGSNPVRVIIATWPWGAYLGDDALQKGIRVRTSSFSRHHVNVMMTKAKVCGNYVNSVLAKREAVADGYDEALMLDVDGYVAEATGENIFIVKHGVLKTPPLGPILGGITRDCLITLARDMGYSVIEQRFTRDELYNAEEAFFCGTAAEVTPIREVDRRQIGAGQAGPVTQLLQQEYFRVVRGENLKYAGWLHHFDS